MIGYKAFDKDLKCREFQFKVGKTYKTGYKKEDLRLCSNTVFHFCRELEKIEISSEYRIETSRICEVVTSGDIVTDNVRYGTNKITILREIPKEEIATYRNNSGKYNSGKYNSGYYNTGDCNSGDYNTGNCNSGHYNSGKYNTGNWNSGDWNSGDCNSGDWNTGDWNTGNRNSGYFNTTDSPVRIFNKFTNVPLEKINFPRFLYFNSTSKGFFKNLEYKEAFRIAWDNADREDKEKLFKLPNWNNEIFKEISGIDAEKELKENK